MSNTITFYACPCSAEVVYHQVTTPGTLRCHGPEKGNLSCKITQVKGQVPPELTMLMKRYFCLLP